MSDHPWEGVHCVACQKPTPANEQRMRITLVGEKRMGARDVWCKDCPPDPRSIGFAILDGVDKIGARQDVALPGDDKPTKVLFVTVEARDLDGTLWPGLERPRYELQHPLKKG